MKVATILGTRPEIIRLSRVIAALDRDCEHVLIHTGQNYDYELNQVFFDELGIRMPDYFLRAAGRSPAATIGAVIARSDRLLRRLRPDAVLILGDTNSCLSALAAKRNRIPVFHMEAGNRCLTSACRRKSTGVSSITSATSTCPIAPSRASTCCVRASRPTAS